jgi:hypothetical protein
VKWGLVGAALLSTLFGRSIGALTNISLFDYVDEASLALLVVATVITRIKNGNPWRGIPGMGYLLVYAAFLLASSLVREVEPAIFVLSIALTFKGVVLAFCVAQFDFSTKDILTWRRIIIAISVCYSIGMVLNLMLEQEWNAIFGQALDSRFGLPGFAGLFTGQGEAGLVGASLALWGIAAVMTISKTDVVRDWRWAIASAIGTVLTGRRAPIVGMALGILLIYVRRRRVEGMFVSIAIGLVLAVPFWNYWTHVASRTFDDYITSGHRQARTIMTRDMFSVASQYFPFGAGGGRFGSYMAQVHYSPEYISRGYHHIWGMMLPPGNDHFLTDTQWPAVIGEAGYIGAAFAIIGLIKCLAFAIRSSRDPEPALSYMGTGLMAQFFLFAMASVGEVVFFGGSSGLALFFVALGIAVAFKEGRTRSSAEELRVGSTSARTE